MFFEFIGALIWGGAKASDWIKKEQMTNDDVDKSLARGSKTYTDYHGNGGGRIIERAFETNEITRFEIDNYGHRRQVGIKTGRVYQDYTQEKIDQKNEELRKQGKKFHFESGKKFGWSEGGSAIMIKVENDTGLPFATLYGHPYGRPEYWTKHYFKDESIAGTVPGLKWENNQKLLTREEAEPYFDHFINEKIRKIY